MEKMTINGRVYPAKELDFNFVCELGNQGINIDEIDSKIFPAIRTYVAWCMGTTVEVAGEEINQHIINGGNLDELSNAFANAGETSGFFRAINKTTTESNSAKAKKTAKKTEEASE